jgi:HlyD family secretion protein
MALSSWRSRVVAAVVVIGIGVAVFLQWRARAAAPSAATAVVTRGSYTDVVEIRGDVRPVKSTVIMAPMSSGELVIMKLAKNGQPVKKGDVVVEFDAITLRRTIQDKQSELRTTNAEMAQAKVTNANTLKDRESAVIRAGYDVDRAKLALGNIELVAEVEGARAKLALIEAEQKLKEAQAAVESSKAGIEAETRARERKLTKVTGDLERAQASLAALSMVAPMDGTVNILPNNRFYTPTGPQEFRTGDRTYAGAAVLELPDLSAVYLVARIDEADRGRIRNNQQATIRADAVAEREYKGTVTDISLLARADYSSWPPAKQFDLKISLTNPDERLRPGMSAMARIAVGSLDNVLLVPAAVVFKLEGRDVVYRLNGRRFDAVPVEVLRRGRDQAVIQGGVAEGDRISLTQPDSDAGAKKGGA